MPPILPKKAIIDTAKLRRAVAQTLDTSARDVVTDFEQTTATSVTSGATSVCRWSP